MSGDTKRLFEEALRLPESDGLHLAECLLATFDGDPDPDAASAWEEKIASVPRHRGWNRGADPLVGGEGGDADGT